MGTLISILVATKGRIDELQQLLRSLAAMNQRDVIRHEILVINNATDPTTADHVEAIVQSYAALEGDCWIHVREPTAGKSRAINKGIRLSQGGVLAFIDDDVVVAPSWLSTTAKFFERTDFDVKQGAIHIPPDLVDNKEFLTLLERYRTIYYLMKPQGARIKSLNTANVAIRRELLMKTGYFDERLGPGASGTSMDSEFGERVKQVGGRIGYEPNSVVYHQVDWSRLTDGYFRWRNQAEGRSNLLYQTDLTMFALFSGLLYASAGFCLYSLGGSKRKKYRMKGRCFRYAAMLKAIFEGSLDPTPELLPGPFIEHKSKAPLKSKS